MDKRKEILKTLKFGPTGSEGKRAGNSKKTSQKHKPNVLYIITDQHRAQSCGFYGEEGVSTPHLDQLAN